MNDSGESQEVESNHSGRLSHVPSQPEVIPSSRSMLSRDKRLKEVVMVTREERQNQFHEQWERGPLSQEMKSKTKAQSNADVCEKAVDHEFDHGYTYHWTSGQKPHLTKNGRRIDRNISNYVPFVVPCFSTSFSATPTPSSSSSSSQDSVFDVSRYTENPVLEKSGSEKIWLVKVVLQSHRETLRLRIKILPVLIMKYRWSREQKWTQAWVSTVFTLTSRVDFTCFNCSSQTHFASAVGHELVDPKRRTRSFMEKGFM